MKTLHSRIKFLRKKRGITQKELSLVLHMDRSNIANYESGKRVPPIESIVRMAAYFEVSVNYLLLGTESNEETSRMQEIKSLINALAEKDKKIQELQQAISNIQTQHKIQKGIPYFQMSGI
ncbi:MAG: helix-turn-helix domain-containing protein [Cytophagaceae bacterium]|jgi:transcriptional regulator with XRE-family HTH domain|nr:helix-turn-helix domain-containing protein [Cytophagaceae bacterium]